MLGAEEDSELSTMVPALKDGTTKLRGQKSYSHETIADSPTQAIGEICGKDESRKEEIGKGKGSHCSRHGLRLSTGRGRNEPAGMGSRGPGKEIFREAWPRHQRVGQTGGPEKQEKEC